MRNPLSRPSALRSLDGKVIAITGAGSGLGRALALEMASRGGVLALSDIDEVGLVETAALVQAQTGREARVEKVDVRDRHAVREHAGSVVAEHGRVNMVVNNAGVGLHGHLEEVDDEDFSWVMDVDFWGVVHGTTAFLPHLAASGDGHVVNVSSVFGLVGMPGQSAYNAAKFGVRGFTEALRTEMLVTARPVKVTCVHPGGIKTAIARNARTTASHDQAAVARHFDTVLARTSPERAARIVVDGVLAGRPRVLVGADARLLDLTARVTGSGYQRAVALAARHLGP